MRFIIEDVKFVSAHFTDHGDLSTTNIIAALRNVELVDVEDHNHSAMVSHDHPYVLRCGVELFRICLKHAC